MRKVHNGQAGLCGLVCPFLIGDQMAVIEIEVSDFLALSQGERHKPSGEFVSQTLVLTETVTVSYKGESASDRLFLNQTVDYRRSITNQSILQSLGLNHQASKGSHQFITQIIAMWQSARTVLPQAVVQTLNIIQTVSVVLAKAATNTLVMTQTATHTSIVRRTVTDTLNLNSQARGYKNKEDFSTILLPTLHGPNAPEC